MTGPAHRDKLPVDDLLLVLYYADQGSESDEKLRLLASMTQTPLTHRVTDHKRLNWAGTSNATVTAERQQNIRSRDLCSRRAITPER
jgi:hypothetical protein